MILSIVTLTYNKLEYTKKYIESLYKYTQDFELILVDNGSDDGTVEYLQRLKEENGNVKLILNKENLGFSKGNNQGIEIAEGEYIGFLNNDILLYPNWFEECKKVFEEEANVGFVSPRHILMRHEPANEKNYIKYFQSKTYKNQYDKSFDECVFSCVITSREVINKIGVFDESYKLAFFEDNDYKYRAIINGLGVYVANRVCFFHFGSVTSGELNQKLESNRQIYYKKYPFAEYLSASGAEKYELQRMTKQFQVFPLKQIYQIFLLFTKIKNRIKKGL